VWLWRRERRKKGMKVVVCEYYGSVVNVYGDERKEYECGCGEEREEERDGSSGL
jgi:hypothetical protein